MGNDSGLNCLIEKGDVAMEMRYWIWLSTALGAGSRRAEDILRHFANPQELYEQIQTSTAPFPPLTASDYQRSPDSAFPSRADLGTVRTSFY